MSYLSLIESYIYSSFTGEYKMMYELKIENYKNVMKIINKDFIGVEAQSVIEGINPGFIYSDSQTNPTMAMVFHQGEGGFFFIGDHKNQNINRNLLPFIQSEVKEKLDSMDIDEFEFSGDSPMWSPVFRELFKDLDLDESTQTIYSLPSGKSIPTYNLDPAYSIKKIDKELLEDDSIENPGYLVDTLKLWWKSPENFLENSDGFVALKGNELVGRCLIDGKYKDLTAIGIETSEKHRQKGIAAKLASTLIQVVLDSGNKPHWECMETNVLSKKVAEKCGLELDFSYDLFGFCL